MYKGLVILVRPGTLWLSFELKCSLQLLLVQPHSSAMRPNPTCTGQPLLSHPTIHFKDYNYQGAHCILFQCAPGLVITEHVSIEMWKKNPGTDGLNKQGKEAGCISQKFRYDRLWKKGLLLTSEWSFPLLIAKLLKIRIVKIESHLCFFFYNSDSEPSHSESDESMAAGECGSVARCLCAMAKTLGSCLCTTKWS